MLEHQTSIEDAKPQSSRKPQESQTRPGIDFLAGLSPRAASESSAQAHASALNRATGSRPSLASHPLLQLQRRYGNRYVQRVLALSRSGEGEGEVAPEVESAIERSRGGGQGLERGVRGQMESAFGVDFGDVRIHTGAEAHSLNRSVNAVAFTTGSDIFFSNGSYSPESSGGQELLAHELTHVVQQSSSRVQTKLQVGEANDPYEQEAERVSAAVVNAIDRVQRACACGGSAGSDAVCVDSEQKESLATRDPDGTGADDEVTTVDGDGGLDGGTPALGDGGGGDGGTPMSGDAGVAAADNCSVSAGPNYSPSGTIPVTNSGGKKRASFDFSASFATDAATGKKPKCCEVHQFIKWDSTYHSAHGGPPHSGFPSGAAADTWIEDRDKPGKRYGHRSDSFSDPIAGCGDEYKTGTTQDQANGNTYCGRDSPNGPAAALTGQWQFRLDAVDTCSGGNKGSSSVITVNW